MPAPHNLQSQIKQFHLFDDMSEHDCNVVLADATYIQLDAGQVIFEQGDPGDAMYLLLSGRVLIRMQQADGTNKNLNVLQTGDHFGELSLLTQSDRTAMAKTLVASGLLVIGKEKFRQYIRQIPAFSLNVGKQVSRWLKNEINGQMIRHRLGTVALVRNSPASLMLAAQLANWMLEHDKSVHLITDRKPYWLNALKNTRINQDSKQVVDLTDIDLDSFNSPATADHIIVDLDSEIVKSPDNKIRKILKRCERIFIINAANGKNPQDAFTLPGISDKSRTTIFLQPGTTTNQKINYQAVQSDFTNEIHMLYDPETLWIRQHDIARLFHVILNIQIGFALGGGGARALAHIGVLAALEENGLYADRIAGTSGGAIITAMYAAGLEFQQILELFRQEMTPPVWLRHIPNITRWHLMALFRFGLIEKRFRKHLDQLDLGCLPLPAHVVSADLISGQEVIRSQGDLVNCIMESINHPLLGKPIFRDGVCLVDGGVLNNIPSSVLRKNKCNFVVSVDVGAKISRRFGKNHKGTPATEMRPVSYLGTLNRVLEIRGKGLDDTYKNHSDFLIEPDVSRFAFDNFTFGEELFEAGYHSASALIPGLKEKYIAMLKPDNE